jgi:hypothetical protein
MSRIACLVVMLVLPSPAQAQWYAPMRADDRIELRARG